MGSSNLPEYKGEWNKCNKQNLAVRLYRINDLCFSTKNNKRNREGETINLKKLLLLCNNYYY